MSRPTTDYVAIIPISRCGGSPSCPRSWVEEHPPVSVPQGDLSEASYRYWPAVTHRVRGGSVCRLAVGDEVIQGLARPRYVSEVDGRLTPHAPRYPPDEASE